DAVASGIPYWGVCLGAQLLAAATGGTCIPGHSPEVGHPTLTLTDAGRTDPVIAPWAATTSPTHQPTVMSWHSDTFTLPPDAQLLARSDHYPQAFRIGPHAYGMQFHLEVTANLAGHWLHDHSYRTAAEQALGTQGINPFLTTHAQQAPALEQQAHTLMESWLTAIPC
ncbi:type 1 glutamine amidotransferase, partial [Streptomyces sp. NPDC090442]|uniref:type 1 glutamine amidotransferase n=1 Tax=Streptomyces sp. NPDC090442 TaxID=3365962 RepID=UPI00382C41B0